jgi:hypothetical protein
MYLPRDVELGVEGVAGLLVPEVGVQAGVRDDVNAQSKAADFRDGERDAIQRDAAAGDDKRGGFLRDGNLQKPIFARGGLPGGDGAGAVYMPCDKVSAKRVAQAQGRFEIDGVAGAECAQVGDAEGVFQGVEGDGAAANFGGGEAHAIDGDGVAGVGVAGRVRRVDEKGGATVGQRADFRNSAAVLDDAGEHGRVFLVCGDLFRGGEDESSAGHFPAKRAEAGAGVGVGEECPGRTFLQTVAVATQPGEPPAQGGGIFCWRVLCDVQRGGGVFQELADAALDGLQLGEFEPGVFDEEAFAGFGVFIDEDASLAVLEGVHKLEAFFAFEHDGQHKAGGGVGGCTDVDEAAQEGFYVV